MKRPFSTIQVLDLIYYSFARQSTDSDHVEFGEPVLRAGPPPDRHGDHDRNNAVTSFKFNVNENENKVTVLGLGKRSWQQAELAWAVRN